MQCTIKKINGIHHLYSNELATQSAIDPAAPHKIVMQNLQYLMGCLMFMSAPKRILMLGVGGGSLIHFFRHYCPKAHITGVDIDEELINQMHEQFLLPKGDELLHYEFADAHSWVFDNKHSYDLIIVNIFDANHMPSWVLGKDFMQQLAQRLNNNGCVAWNTLISSDHEFNSFYSNLRSVFNQRTLCLASEEYENTLAYSFNFGLEQSDMSSLIQLAEQHSAHYELPFHEILNVLFSTNPIDSGFI